MNFVSTIIVDKKNNKKWLLIGLTIILLGIIVVIVSYKLLNKKPIDDIQKPINYQEQLKEMLEKSTNQSKYKLNIEFDIENNTEKIAYGTYEIMIDHETYIANIDSKVYKNEDIAWVSQYDLRKNVYLNQDQSLQMQEEANPEYIYTLLGNANDVTNTTAIISKDDMTKALKNTNLGYLADEYRIGDKIDVVGTLEINSFNGVDSLQINIKDVMKSI